MPYDAGLAARVQDALAVLGERHARQKNVFGGRGFLVGSTTFVVVWDDGVIVKVPAGEYAAALAEPGVAPFQPDGARPMSTWVVVPAESVADDPELQAWVERGLRAVR
jgi:TfoX/Sxy family transcriptional regulator of competence genes